MNNAMIGIAAVGIVIVDGPAGTPAAFTPAERLTIAVEVSQAFDILYQLSASSPVNPHLIFLAEQRLVSLTLDPASVPAPTGNAAAAEYEACEAPWRDAALAALGFGAGQAGVSAYVQTLLSKNWPLGITPSSAYAAFFTKYNAAWMAYCQPNRLSLVMQYPWLADTTGTFVAGKTGWGAANIDRVFAHESGHIFGAPDEYLASHCSTTATFGALGVANGNCQASATTPVSPCLMLNNTSSLCAYTPGHWGWVDANADGLLDAVP
jgi:hypothetical protein